MIKPPKQHLKTQVLALWIGICVLGISAGGTIVYLVNRPAIDQFIIDVQEDGIEDVLFPKSDPPEWKHLAIALSPRWAQSGCGCAWTEFTYSVTIVKIHGFNATMKTCEVEVEWKIEFKTGKTYPETASVFHGILVYKPANMNMDFNMCPITQCGDTSIYVRNHMQLSYPVMNAAGNILETKSVWLIFSDFPQGLAFKSDATTATVSTTFIATWE